MMQHNSIIGINDVLLGRGGATNNHEGNKRFRTLVAYYQTEYLAAKKKEKAAIAHKIVSEVTSTGGRFLRRDANNVWVEVPDKRAREKTSQALREGLDVRNHTIRATKQIKQKVDANSKETPKMVVTGWVKPPAPAAVAPLPPPTPNVQISGDVPGFRQPKLVHQLQQQQQQQQLPQYHQPQPQQQQLQQPAIQYRSLPLQHMLPKAYIVTPNGAVHQLPTLAQIQTFQAISQAAQFQMPGL